MATTFHGAGGRKNDRRHPGFKGPRPDRVNIRREEAKARQAKYDALSLDQKLASLTTTNGNPSRRNGKAKKQKDRLLALQKSKT